MNKDINNVKPGNEVQAARITEARGSNVKRVCIIGIMTSLAMIFSYIEGMIPIALPIPGVRLGLANLIILLVMLTQGPIDAFITGLIRIILSALLFGNVFSFSLSLTGFVLSFSVMLILVKTKRFSVPGVSMASGALHNIGQLICASLLIHSKGILTYTFVLVIVGILTGLINGFICKMIYERTKKHDWLS